MTPIEASGPSTTPSRGWRALSLVATLAACALLGIVIAYALWKLLAPPQVHVPPSEPDDPAGVLLASGLFSRGAPPSRSLDVLLQD